MTKFRVTRIVEESVEIETDYPQDAIYEAQTPLDYNYGVKSATSYRVEEVK